MLLASGLPTGLSGSAKAGSEFEFADQYFDNNLYLDNKEWSQWISFVCRGGLA